MADQKRTKSSSILYAITLLVICAFSFTGCGGKDEKKPESDQQIPPVIQKAPVAADVSLYEVALNRARVWQPDAALLRAHNTRENEESALDGKSNFWVLEFISPGIKTILSITITNYEITGTNQKPSAESDVFYINDQNWRISSDAAYLKCCESGGVADYLSFNRHAYADYELIHDPDYRRIVWRIRFSDDDEAATIIDARSGKILKRMHWKPEI